MKGYTEFSLPKDTKVSFSFPNGETKEVVLQDVHTLYLKGKELHVYEGNLVEEMDQLNK